MRPEHRVEDSSRPDGFRDYNGSWIDDNGRRLVVLRRVGAWPCPEQKPVVVKTSRLCMGFAEFNNGVWALQNIQPVDFSYENKRGLPFHQFEDPRLFLGLDGAPALSAVLCNLCENTISMALSLDFNTWQFPAVGQNRAPHSCVPAPVMSHPSVIEMPDARLPVSEKNWAFFPDFDEGVIKAVYYFDPFTIVNLKTKKIEIWGTVNARARKDRSGLLKGSTPPRRLGKNEWWCLTHWFETDSKTRGRVYKIAECRFNLKTKKMWVSDIVCDANDLSMVPAGQNYLKCVFPCGCEKSADGKWEILAGVHDKELWCFSYENVPDNKMIRAI